MDRGGEEEVIGARKANLAALGEYFTLPPQSTADPVGRQYRFRGAAVLPAFFDQEDRNLLILLDICKEIFQSVLRQYCSRTAAYFCAFKAVNLEIFLHSGASILS
jgi:hypothetical protein